MFVPPHTVPPSTPTPALENSFLTQQHALSLAPLSVPRLVSSPRMPTLTSLERCSLSFSLNSCHLFWEAIFYMQVVTVGSSW